MSLKREDKCLVPRGKMAVSKVTRNYQVTVPREIRERVGIKEGDTLLFTVEGQDVILKKVNKELLDKSFGLWKKAQERTPWLVNRLLRKETDKRLRG